MHTSILLSQSNLSLEAAFAEVRSPSLECGAVDVFVGTVRNSTNGKAVLYLEFEAYKSMATRELERIAGTLHERWDARAAALHHRVGRVEVGGVAVIIAVATPHRAASFEACRFAIDTLKERVPIWKKEVFASGAVWVVPHA
jgi:molybdopterin synthase catalytic subunit